MNATILLTGKSGQVGGELLEALAPLGRLVAPDHTELDLTSPDALWRAVREMRPSIIVNAAAYTAVDRAESEPSLAAQVNTTAPEVLADEARRCGALLVHYSTDYVFDGAITRPYTETDEPRPLSAYGRTKLAGEQAIAASGTRHLVLRTSWVYSARRSNFVLTMLKLAREREELAVVTDQTGSPTWARALARATAELLTKIAAGNKAEGLYHLSAGGSTTRHALVARIIELAQEYGLGSRWARLREARTTDFLLPAQRPPYSALDNTRIRNDFGVEMPHWDMQLREFLRDLLPPGSG